MKMSFPRPHSVPANASLGLDTILALGDEEPNQRRDRTEEDASLLALIDGRRTVAEILRVSRMSGSVAMRRLRALSERRVIRTVLARPTTIPGGRPLRTNATQDLSAVADQFVEMRHLTPNGPPVMVSPSLAQVARATAAGQPAAYRMMADEAMEFSRTPVTPPPVVVEGPARTARAPGPVAQTRALAPAMAPAREAPEQALIPVTAPDGYRPGSGSQSFRNGQQALMPVSALASQVQDLWFNLAKRDWATLVLIPAHPRGSALEVGRALTEIGSAYGDRPVQLLCAEGRELSPIESWTFPRKRRGPAPGHSRLPLEERRVIVLDPLALNPSGAAVAQAADAVVVVVETGVAQLTSVRRVIESIGRSHLVGCVMVSAG